MMNKVLLEQRKNNMIQKKEKISRIVHFPYSSNFPCYKNRREYEVRTNSGCVRVLKCSSTAIFYDIRTGFWTVFEYSRFPLRRWLAGVVKTTMDAALVTAEKFSLFSFSQIWLVLGSTTLDLNLSVWWKWKVSKAHLWLICSLIIAVSHIWSHGPCHIYITYKYIYIYMYVICI